MSRHLLIVILALFSVLPALAWNNAGPPISITSPDKGTTFPRGDIKNHTLLWSKNRKVLMAVIIFTDARMNDGTPREDTHYFQLPGVSFDEAKGLFTATAANGEVIPVAQMKKTLFLKNIVVLPNATIRILYPSGDITVRLEAISPNDPAMHAPPPKDPNENPDGTHNVDLKSLLN